MSKIPIARPNIGQEEWEALRDPIMSGWIAQGPKVKEFEEVFARRHEVKHAVAVSSGTAALHLMLLALGCGPGDEVIVPAFTWVASANAVRFTGATPRFADIDLETFNLTVESVLAVLTPRTKVVMAVHQFGRCAPMRELREALPLSVELVEDAACAVGGHSGERSVGGLGRAAAFSFHPRKVITTGEGGMVTTDDGELAAVVRALRNHGGVPRVGTLSSPVRPYDLPDFPMVGYNYRLTDLQAAIGLVQLGKLDRLLAEREVAARLYHERLGGVAWLRLPSFPARGVHCWQSFVVRVDPSCAPLSRDVWMGRLFEGGVETRVGTTLLDEGCGGALEAFLGGVALPMGAGEVVEGVCFSIRSMRPES
jgi:perosamine synthetase